MYIFTENRADNVEKCGWARQATDDSIGAWALHVKQLSLQTQWECVILIAFPRRQWLRESVLNVTLYVHCLTVFTYLGIWLFVDSNWSSFALEVVTSPSFQQLNIWHLYWHLEIRHFNGWSTPIRGIYFLCPLRNLFLVIFVHENFVYDQFSYLATCLRNLISADSKLFRALLVNIMPEDSKLGLVLP